MEAFWLHYGVAASVDWCEPNYVYTPYVAEMWNAASSLPMVVLGLFGAWRAFRGRPIVEGRYLVAFLGLALIGVGSTAFHGTLLRSAQALDELPMIYASLVFAYCVVNRRPGSERRARWWALGFTAYAVGFTAAYFLVPAYFTMFILSYATIVTLVIVASIRLALGPEGSPVLRRLLGLGVVAYVGGVFFLWIPEHVLLACDHPFQSLQPHAWFHLTSVVGTYAWILFALWDRHALAGRGPVLERLPAPFVEPEASRRP
jgi:dihydroceramidase